MRPEVDQPGRRKPLPAARPTDPAGATPDDRKSRKEYWLGIYYRDRVIAAADMKLSYDEAERIGDAAKVVLLPPGHRMNPAG